jgi:hypothetical protein
LVSIVFQLFPVGFEESTVSQVSPSCSCEALLLWGQTVSCFPTPFRCRFSHFLRFHSIVELWNFPQYWNLFRLVLGLEVCLHSLSY